MISARGLFSSEAAGLSSLLKRDEQVKETKKYHYKAKRFRAL
jgi:hypothetical protein